MKITPAQIVFKDGGIPYSESFGDIYFSPEGGLAETLHVFVEGNLLRDRWRDERFTGQNFVIGETGFGTGLNFLVALAEWRASGAHSRGNQLTFISCELHPIRLSDLEKAHAFFPELREFSELLLKRYPILIPGYHWIHFPEFGAHLALFLGSANEFFQEILSPVDAWFLDGFAPSKNPEMWGEQLAAGLARLSHSGTTAATFSVSATVKNPLKWAGFTLEKKKGFGRKREMLTARYAGESKAVEELSFASSPLPSSSRVCVVGGGLAGCVLAGKLADRGYIVTLLEKNGDLCGEASGNPAGIFMPYFTAGENSASDLGLTAFSYFTRHWDLWWKNESRPVGARCGVWSWVDDEEAERVRRGVARLGIEWDQDFLQEKTPADFSERAGFGLHPESESRRVFLMGSGGWTRAEALAKAQIAQKDHLSVRTGIRVIGVEDVSQGEATRVRVTTENSGILEFDSVVIACAHTYREALGWSPGFQLSPLRGQVAELPVDSFESWRLNQPLSYDGYLAPYEESGRTLWSLGSTFDLREDSPVLDREKNKKLLMQFEGQFEVANHWSSHSHSGFDPGQGRVGFRCTTPDRVPVLGPALAPESAALDGVRGVHVFLGFGSRGINWIPLAAEILAAALRGEPDRLLKSQKVHLHSSRFRIRELRKRRK